MISGAMYCSVPGPRKREGNEAMNADTSHQTGSWCFYFFRSVCGGVSEAAGAKLLLVFVFLLAAQPCWALPRSQLGSRNAQPVYFLTQPGWSYAGTRRAGKASKKPLVPVLHFQPPPPQSKAAGRPCNYRERSVVTEPRKNEPDNDSNAGLRPGSARLTSHSRICWKIWGELEKKKKKPASASGGADKQSVHLRLSRNVTPVQTQQTHSCLPCSD